MPDMAKLNAGIPEPNPDVQRAAARPSMASSSRVSAGGRSRHAHATARALQMRRRPPPMPRRNYERGAMHGVADELDLAIKQYGPRCARIEAGGRAHAELEKAADVKGPKRAGDPSIPWGVPVTTPGGMPPAAWRVVDADGVVLSEGIVV